MSRGIENPLLSYAQANNIVAPQLILADGNWGDHEGCIARRNWLPYRTEEYRDMLTTSPFEFVDDVEIATGAGIESEMAPSTGLTPSDEAET